MLFILIMTDWGSNSRALSKALGVLCNPRWPAAHGRSSPTTGTTSSQAHSAAPPITISFGCKPSIRLGIDSVFVSSKLADPDKNK